jgi:hypothetical protein
MLEARYEALPVVATCPACRQEHQLVLAGGTQVQAGPVVVRGLEKREVCRVRPACGCPEYNRIAPLTLIAYVRDRKCLECQTEYTPPTPLWAALVFIILGVPLALVGGYGALINLMSPGGSPLCSALLAFLGGACVL